MATISTIRTGLKTRLDTVTGLRAYAEAPGSVTPAPGNAVAVVVPAPGAFLVRDSQGSLMLNFVVKLLVGAALTVEAQKALDGFLDPVFTALENDTIALGDGGEFVQGVVGSSYGDVTYAGVLYYGAEWGVSVGAI